MRDHRLVFLPIVVLFLLSALPLKGFAQANSLNDSPRSLALSHSEIADPREPWSINPAIQCDSSRESQTRLITIFTPLPHGVSDSWNAGMGGAIPIDEGYLLAVTFSRYQYSDIFSSQYFSLESSKRIGLTEGRDAVVGIRSRYIEENFGDHYLPLKEITADLGITFSLSSEFHIGTSITHLLSLYRNQDVIVEYPSLWLGMSYCHAHIITLYAAAEGSTDHNYSPHDVALHLGVEYLLDPRIVLRVGTETASSSISGGVGIRLHSLTADFAATDHPDLGMTLSFGIGYSL